MNKISNHKNTSLDDGVRPGGTTSPGLDVKMVQFAALSVVKKKMYMDGVFSVVQVKCPHAGVAKPLYEMFHYRTLMHKKDSYQYDNSSHIKTMSIRLTLQARHINNIHVTQSIPPTWNKRDLKHHT